MKVYSVISNIQYEGSELWGVFGSHEDALRFVQKHQKEREYLDFGIVESELGEEVDMHAQVEWI